MTKQDKPKLTFRKAKVKVAVSTKKTRPLFVELPVEDLDRYKQLADAKGMTMRDLVRAALEAEWARSRQEKPLLAQVLEAQWKAHTEEREGQRDAFAAALASRVTESPARPPTEPPPSISATEIAMPRVYHIEGSMVQLVDIAALQRKLIAQDARIGQLEATVEALSGFVAEHDPDRRS